MDRFFDLFKSLIPNFESLLSASPASAAGPGWMFGVLGTVAVSLFGLSMGRTRAVISLLTLYIAFFLEMIFPFSEQAKGIISGTVADHWLDLGFFVTAYVAVFFVFNFSIIRKRMSSMDFSLPGIIVLSILQLGLATSIVLNILPASATSEWTYGLSKYFSNSMALFAWAIAPLPVLLFIKK